MRSSLFAIVSALSLTACAAAPACPDPEPQVATAGDEEPSPPSPPAEVRRLEDAPRRAAPTGTATVAFLARGNNAFVAELVMEPGASVPEHQDSDEEYIVVLQGRGTMRIDGVEHEVTPGSTIFMPAGATVSFQNGDERLVAIQVFAGPGSAAKYERWTPVAPGE